MRSNEQVRIAPGNPQTCRGHGDLFIGGGKGHNNNHNPTLRDHENARGKSGEAIHGSKKVAGEPSRKESRTESSPQ